MPDEINFQGFFLWLRVMVFFIPRKHEIVKTRKRKFNFVLFLSRVLVVDFYIACLKSKK